MNVRPKKLPVVRSLRCSHEEDRELLKAVEASGLSISDYLRSVVPATSSTSSQTKEERFVAPRAPC